MSRACTPSLGWSAGHSSLSSSKLLELKNAFFFLHAWKISYYSQSLSSLGTAGATTYSEALRPNEFENKQVYEITGLTEKASRIRKVIIIGMLVPGALVACLLLC